MNKSSKKHEEVIHSSKHLSHSFIERWRYFYNGKEKVINIAGISAGIVLIAVLAYMLFYIPGQQKKAEVAIYKAEQYFAMDSLMLALNGDGQYDGVLSVIDNYGNTKTGNRAKYIAGICYLKLGQYDEAIEYLKKFKSRDKLVSVQALGSLGDAYMEKNDLDNAAKYYKKAVSKNENDLITPVYLLRLGMLYEMQGKWSDAASYYEQLQQDYTQSHEAMEIEKRIAYVKTKSKL
ncbi:MAG: tetratricopeptide repeat protein [Bacteroidales bacterium]|jgi:tetratricopeptide (TPR) repeat protein|nr:tetratricopeptide repeat protein [Bacteroidales bacterium]